MGDEGLQRMRFIHPNSKKLISGVIQKKFVPKRNGNHQNIIPMAEPLEEPSTPEEEDAEKEEGKEEGGTKKKRRWMTVKWLFYLAWALALTYTLHNISKSVHKYLSKPVSTKINVYHNEHGSMQFPTISLCNLNRVSKSYLEEEELLEDTWNTVSDWGSVDWTQEGMDDIGNLPYQDFYRNSPSWEDTKIFCAYAHARRCEDMDIFADPSNMVEEELSPTGKCFRFNPNGVLHSKAGDYGSVYLRLNANQRDYIDNTGQIGFVMAIHHYTQYSSTRNTGIIMSPGLHYRVTLKRIERRELPEEDGGKCNSALQRNSYGAYDLESCHTECRDKQLNASCGCIPVLPPYNIYNYTACSLRQMNECGQWAYHQFVLDESQTSPEKGEERECGCWVPCEHFDYELSVATTAIPREYAAGKIRAGEGEKYNYTVDDFLKNNVILETYFRDMYSEQVFQVREYDFWNLLADIGGMLGLFLGASIFTIIDFIRYSVKFGYRKLRVIGIRMKERS